MAAEQAFKAVINDTNPASDGRAFGIEITGSNYNHFLGKKIGDSVDGMFVGEGDKSLSGYKLEITGGSDLTGRPMRPELAGGGIKPGITYGRTDDYAYNIADADGNMIRPTKDKWTPGTMHIHDLNATILNQLGIDHRKLTYRYQGRDFRLTDVHGHVIKDLIA